MHPLGVTAQPDVDNPVCRRSAILDRPALFCLWLLLFMLFLFLAGCSPQEAVSGQGTDPLDMDKPILILRSGTTNTLVCSRAGEPADNLVWNSTDENIAKVDQKGQVTAISKGTAIITAASQDGRASGTSAVTVDRDPLPKLAELKAARYRFQNGLYINAAAPADKAVLMLTGDLMCLLRQQRKAATGDTYNFNASFDKVKVILAQGDLVIGNLETMLSHTWPYKIDETSIDGQWNCNAPSTYLAALRYAGFDAVVNANNHSCDTGPQGLLETISHLDDYQMMHTGLFTSKDQPHYILADVNGIKVAFLSYAYKFNGLDAGFSQEQMETMISVYSKEAVKKDVAQAKACGAEFIVAYIHWGSQNDSQVNGTQRSYAQAMADAGVDYIIGSHPHVLQPYERIRASDGRIVPVLYSMGNFIASSDEVPGNRDSIILQVVLQKAANRVKVTGEGYYACYVLDEYDGVSTVVVPISLRYRGGVMSSALAPAHERIVDALGSKIVEIQ